MAVNELRFRSDMLAAGFTDDELRALRDRKKLRLFQPGAYLVAGEFTPERRHVLKVEAAIRRLAGDAVVSGVSAALVHGLDTWNVPLNRVHVLRPGPTGGRRGRLVHVHTAQLPDDEVVSVGHVPVTSVARTVVDLARSAPFEQAVVVIDDALHNHRATRPEIEAVLERRPTARGTAAARRAVDFANPGAESVGESRSRVAMYRCGLVAPRLQWPVSDHSGRVVAKCDFGWEEQRVAGEFDGMMKYGRGRKPGQSAGAVVAAEKYREDQVRDTDARVVRWVWADLDTFEVVAARLQRVGVPRRRR